jgi:metal-sulfur cluster biosynthetic enzyme
MPEVVSVAAVRAVLNEILDPCSVAARAPAGLDDMGLVEAVAISSGHEGAVVTVTLCTTHPMCLVAAVFMTDAHRRVSAVPGVSEVEVRLGDSVNWTSDRMAPAYREQLAIAGTTMEGDRSGTFALTPPARRRDHREWRSGGAR